jgi:hypothetical protein
MSHKQPVVEVAHAARQNGDEHLITLSDGRRARLVPVSAALIDEVSSRIEDPAVPTFFNEEKGREEENPFDPAYLRATEDIGRRRGLATLDAMIMFGVELLEGLPEDDGWVKKLVWMEKHDRLDLSGYDLDDEIDREFVYKRYIACPPTLAQRIGQLSGLSATEVAAAERSFPGDETR